MYLEDVYNERRFNFLTLYYNLTFIQFQFNYNWTTFKKSGYSLILFAY